MKHQLISIAGTLGVGKSTLVKIIAEELQYHSANENYSANPFLEKFYRDMKKWAFHSQAFFLLEKIKQLQEIEKLMIKHPVVQDVPIYEDVFSYAKAHFLMGNISRDEWSLYFRIYRMFEDKMVKPQLIIYLTAPVKTIADRVLRRDRKIETEESGQKFIKYLKILQKLNEEWIKSVGKHIKIVKIETDGFDYRKDKTERKKLIMKLKNLL